MRHFLCAFASCLITSSAFADLPDGFVYDDAAFLVELTNHETNRNNQAVDEGWHFDVDARIWAENRAGNIPTGSTFRVKLKKGRRELANFVCESTAATSPSYHLPEGAPASLWIDHCNDSRELRIQQTGDLTLEMYFINGGDDSETLVRTHHFAVHKFTRTRGGTPDADRYHIVYSSEVTSAYLHDTMIRPAAVSRDRRRGNGQLLLVTWVAENERNGVEPSSPSFDGDLSVRCTVDGERIDIPGNVEDVANPTYAYNRSWGQGRRNEREQYAVDRFLVLLPIATRPVHNSVQLSDHPGAWACELRKSRQTVRTFSFTVADGAVQAHAEETSGNVHLQPGAHMVTMGIPSSPTLETRLSPAETEHGPFFGVGWSTPEGRAIGAAVPREGETRLGGSGRRRGRRR